MRTHPRYTGLRFVAWLMLVMLVAAFAAGCTAVKYGEFSYTNVGFEKQVGKLSFQKHPDGSVTGTVEGVTNGTPQIVEAAVGAALRNAKP